MTIARVIIVLLAFSCGPPEPGTNRAIAPLGSRTADAIDHLRSACGTGSFTLNEFLGAARCQLDAQKYFEVRFGSSWEVSQIALSGYAVDSELMAANDAVIEAVVPKGTVELLRRALRAPSTEHVPQVTVTRFAQDGRLYSILATDRERASKGVSPLGTLELDALSSWTRACSRALTFEATHEAVTVGCSDEDGDWTVTMTTRFQVWRVRVATTRERFEHRARSVIAYVFPEIIRKSAEASLLVPSGPMDLNLVDAQRPVTLKTELPIEGPQARRTMTWEVSPLLFP